MRVFSSILLVAALMAMGSAVAEQRPPQYAARQVRVDIRPQPLRLALTQFAQQTGVQLLFSADDVPVDASAPRLVGTYTLKDALQQLLAQTRLRAQFINPRTVAIHTGASVESSALIPSSEEVAGKDYETDTIRLAQNDQGAGGVSGPHGPESEKGNSPDSGDSSGGKLEEIIVTARQRKESLQDVPISIAVVSGDRLADNNIEALDDLQRAVPNIVLTESTGGSQSALYLRGIGTYSHSAAVDPSIAFVLDGVPLGVTGGIVNANFDDIERIEVLRGPQGTLFGKNASAGVIQVVTKDPTDTFTANMGVGYGSYQELKANGAISGPIVAGALSGRLSLWASKRDGYVYNIQDDTDLGDDNQFGMRGKLLFTPAEGTKISLGMYMLQREQSFFQGPNIPVAVSPLSPPPDIQYLTQIANPTNDKVNGIGSSLYADRIHGGDLRVDQGLGSYTLTSIFGYERWLWDQNPGNHLGFNATPALPPLVPMNYFYFNQHQYSEELRLSSPLGPMVDYVLGGFFFKQRYTYNGDLVIDLTQQGAPEVLADHVRSYVDTLNYAGFAELNTHLSSTFTLITGGRWTHEDKSIHLVGLPAGPGQFGFLTSAAPGTTYDDYPVNNWSWRFGPRWQPTPNQSFYATASRGFKGPAFDTNSAVLGESFRTKPEISTSYEVGAKSNFFNKRLSTTLALYYMTVRDFQVEANAPYTPPGAVEPTTALILTNAPKLVSKGAEFEMRATPRKDIDMGLAMAYVDATYGSFANSTCWTNQTAAEGCVNGNQSLTGKGLAFSPRMSGNFDVNYHFPLPGRPFDGFVRGAVSWRSSINWDSALAPNAAENDTALVDLFFGINANDDRYKLTFFVKNLANKYNTQGISGGNTTVYVFLLPTYQRTYGLNLAYNF